MRHRSERVYLDYNATSPLDEQILGGMQPFFSTEFGNPSSRDHAYGWDASEAVEEGRSRVAGNRNVRPRRDCLYQRCDGEHLHGLAKLCPDRRR